MSTKLLAYDLQLSEVRFHTININIQSYENINNNEGKLSIETSLKFGIDSNSLFCTVAAKVRVIPNGYEESDTDNTIDLDVAGTGIFYLGEGHDVTQDTISNLTTEEVLSFSNILDPLLVGKIRETLVDAGINGFRIPLQLKTK